jgi:plasmid stabilization system protein ParE
VIRLRLDSAARAELLHETTHYETTRRGAGLKFSDAVADAFGQIKRVPKTGKPDEEGCRRMRIKAFPLSVVYREEATEIVVYAIRPDAREPGYWLPRVL